MDTKDKENKQTLSEIRQNDQGRMTEGSIAGAITHFAIPLFWGNLFQQIYTSVDSLIVGNLLGNNSLAAVSATTMPIQLMISFIQGVFLGAGVLVARFYGARMMEHMRRAIHTTITIALTIGVFLSVFGILIIPVILHWMGTPEDIFDQAVTYSRVYFAGALGLITYNACTSIMQALGDSKHPLYYLISSSLTNIFLDFLFIAVFHWGIFSTALATAIAQFLSAILCMIRLHRAKDESRVEFRLLGYDWSMIRQFLNYGLPSGFQISLPSLANVYVQSNINAFGTMAVAGCGAYDRIDGFAYLPIACFNSVLTTFIGQNYGAKEYKRMKRGARIGILCSVCISGVIGMIMVLMGTAIISAFTKEPEAIAHGVTKLNIRMPFYFLLALAYGLAAVMRGVGKPKIPTMVILGCFCIVRVIFIYVFVHLTGSIKAVHWNYPVTWGLSSIILLVYCIKSDWGSNGE